MSTWWYSFFSPQLDSTDIFIIHLAKKDKSQLHFLSIQAKSLFHNVDAAMNCGRSFRVCFCHQVEEIFSWKDSCPATLAAQGWSWGSSDSSSPGSTPWIYLLSPPVVPSCLTGCCCPPSSHVPLDDPNKISCPQWAPPAHLKRQVNVTPLRTLQANCICV